MLLFLIDWINFQECNTYLRARLETQPRQQRNPLAGHRSFDRAIALRKNRKRPILHRNSIAAIALCSLAEQSQRQWSVDGVENLFRKRLTINVIPALVRRSQSEILHVSGGENEVVVIEGRQEIARAVGRYGVSPLISLITRLYWTNREVFRDQYFRTWKLRKTLIIFKFNEL